MNNNSDLFTATIEELSLTGNQPIETMKANKIQWKTQDDAQVKKSRVSGDTADTIELQQQRIRVFSVKYAAPTEFLQ
jgi:hypothetical protein